MPTFPRGFVNFQAHVHNAQLLARLARETSGNVEAERKRLLMAATPADSLTLRGIPAIGHGVAGVIRGSQPEQEAVSREW